MDYCRRRILVTEWVDGINLNTAPKDEIAEVIPIMQESFLRQLLSVGYFHNDPHPGNLLLMKDRSKGTICILDYGLMVEIPEKERENMISAVIHVSNRNWPALTEDFIDLGFYPNDVPKAKANEIAERVLSPYIMKGGGANAFKGKGSEDYTFQQVTQDVIKAQVELPQKIPTYISQLGRAIAILEGQALSADPNYKLVMEAYPFVTRRLLNDQKERTQLLLRETLYDEKGRIKPQRL